MARFFVGIGAALVVVIALTIGAALVVGRVRGGEILAYAAQTNAFSGRSEVYLWDLTYRFSVRWILEGDHISRMSLGTNGQLATVSCDTTCVLVIWDSQRFYELSSTIEGSPVWSNDGRLAFQACDRGVGCHIVFWENGNLDNPPELLGVLVHALSWSADGRLAFDSCVEQCDIMLWDGTTLLNLTTTEDIDERSPVWSSDGRLAFQACVLAEGCDLMLWDGTGVSRLTTSSNVHEHSYSWSPDGQLAFNECDPDCHVMIWDDGVISRLSDDVTRYDAPPQWNSLGQLAFQPCYRICELLVWDAGEVYQILEAHNIKPHVAWSSDGQLIFQVCDSDNMCDLWLWDGVTAFPLTNTPTLNEVSPMWLP
jgi:WD40 repeat protein